MKLLIIGRSYPEVETGMVGIFEYEQAQAISKYYQSSIKTLYTFCDNRSIFRLRRFKSIKKYDRGITVNGKYFPVGGFPNKAFEKIKTRITINMLKNAINKFGKPDIIHIHFPIITLTEGIWDYLTGLQSNIVITEHYSRVQNKELSFQQIKLLKKIALEADKFLCVNNLLPKSIVELTGIEREYIEIPNVVAPIFNLQKNSDNGNYRFISIGRLVKEKNFDALIEAFTKKFSDSSSVELIIVGGGEEYKNLQKKIDSLNMHKKIKLTGFLDRKKTAQILENSNSYVTASSFETFGVPVVEALSCGKPVVVADTSPLKQYINKERGLVFSVGDIDSLAFAMEKIYERRSFFNNKEIAGFAEQYFSEKAIGEKLHSIYRSCLNKQVCKE
jgi:L-malate glycosyltransferase